MNVRQRNIEIASSATVYPKGELGFWVGTGKPVAMAYVDDRAVPFDGSWEYALEKINGFVHGRLDTP